MVQSTSQHIVKQHLSWTETEELVRRLASTITSSPAMHSAARRAGIVPVMRGGLIPATMLSHILDAPIAYAIKPQTDHMVRTVLPYLLIDDICDTGQTFRQLRKYMPSAYHIALLSKPAGESACNLSVDQVDDNVWVQFPWERES